MATIRQQVGEFRQVVVLDQSEAWIVLCLPRRDVRPHGPDHAVDAEVNPGREATAQTAESCVRYTLKSQDDNRVERTPEAANFDSNGTRDALTELLRDMIIEY